MTRLDSGALLERAVRVRELLEKDPEDPRLWTALGRALLALGLSSEAVAPFENAVRLDEQHTPAYRDLGRAYLECGNPGEAARVFAHAIALAERTDDHETGREIHALLKLAERRDERPRSDDR